MSMKKILAALLLMMMVLTAAGAMASANLRVRNRDMQVGQYAYVSWGNEIALSQTKPESGGYVYYRSDNVMEMHDFQFPSYGSFQYTIGVTSGSGLFTMEIYGDNLVNNAYSGQAASTATAIFCALPLEIKLMNGATLRAEATATSEGNQAIWASETLAVTGSGTLNAVGGNTNVSYQNSYGIRVGNSSGASTAMTVGSGVALNAQSGSAPLESMGIYVKQGKLSSAGHITAQSGAGVSEDYAIDASAVEITAGSMTAKAADTSSPAMNTAPSVYTGADVLVSKTSNAAHDPSLAYAASQIGQYTFVQVDKAKPEHAHYACGEDECENTSHAHTAARIEYAALDPDYDDGEAWMTGTAYYLKEDIEIKNYKQIVFANTGTVYLCLNGHTITSHEALNSLTANGNLVLCDCQGDGVITRKADMTGRGVYVSGDMTMYGGKISGHHDTGIWGGGAYVGGDMTMYGGTISNNSAQNGAGGVYAVNGLTMHGGKISGNETQRNGGGVLTGSSGVISLYGGEISGNTAAKGGGLYAASGNTVNVSGAPFVMNNLAKGAENNIELSSDVNLKLTGALTGDEQTIGVTKAGVLPIQFMEAAGTAVNHTYVKKIYSDAAYLKDVQNGYGVFYGNHTISVTANPYDGGTVSGTGRYKSGEKCYLYATPSTGYTFVNWTDEDGNVFSTEANHNFIVTWNETLTANFKADTFTVTAQSENPAMGGVSISPAADSEGKYPYGKFVTLLATPADGYTFAGWYSAGQKVSDQASYTFAVMSNAALTARFKAVSYTITYDLAGGELPQGASNPAGYSVDSEAITLANPEKTGHTFAGWTGTGLTEATQTVTIPTGSTGNRSYTATWTKNAAPAHTHYVCGEDACTVHSGMEHLSVTYTPYVAGMTLEGGMAVYLTENMTVSEMIEISSMDAVYLCLNGFTLTADGDFDVIGGFAGNIVLCDCKGTGKITHAAGKKGSGIRFSHNGWVTMYGGEISGNTPVRGGGGGGVDTGSQGHMTMHGGKICGNTGGVGGGVNSSNSFYMYGGEISGNTASLRGGGVAADFMVQLYGGTITGNTAGEIGGGVYIDSRGYPVVKGDMTITGNHKGSGEDAQANNLFLHDGNTLTVIDALTGRIGVTTQNAPTITTPVVYLKPSSEYTLTDSDLAATFSDEGYDQRINSEGNGELYINAVTYTLSAAAAEGGSAFIFADNATQSSPFTAVQGQAVVFSAQADEGKTFIGWYEGDTLVSDQPEYAFTAERDMSLTARFGVECSLTLNAVPIHGGTTSGSTSALLGTQVTAQAAANEGWVFTGWYEGGTPVSDQAVYTFAIAGDTVLDAHFERAKYTVSVDVVPAGAGMVTGTGEYESDTDITLTAAANEGYEFAGWYDGDTCVESWKAYQLTVDKPVSLTARFVTGHVHTACGFAGCTQGDHAQADHVNMTFAPFDPYGDIQSGAYYLKEDFEIKDTITISSGETVRLCLNGHKLEKTTANSVFDVHGTLVLCDCSASGAGVITHTQKADGTGAAVKGSGVTVNGALRMYGGAISGNDGTEGSGAGVHVSGSAHLSGNAKISGNTGSSAVYAYGSVTMAGNAQISNNKAKSAAAADIAHSASLTMSGNAKISGNTSESLGMIELSGSMTMSGNAEVSGNTAKYGGGVKVNGSNANLTMSGDAKITGNTATGAGGGVYVAQGTLAMEGGEISDNKAPSGGGVNVVSHASLTMSGDARITGNTAESSGGGVVMGIGAALQMEEEAAITGNTAGESGGGVYGSTEGSIALDGGSISGNTAKYGGGICTLGADVAISGDAAVSGNTAESGGGIYGSDGTVTLDSGSITGNTAEYGGGIYTMGADVCISGDAVISANTATEYGGGVYGSRGSISLDGGSITGNTAKYGGGVWASSYSDGLTVSGSAVVKNNTAGSDAKTSNIDLGSRGMLTCTGPLTGSEGSIGVTKSGMLPVVYMTPGEGVTLSKTDRLATFSDEGYATRINGDGNAEFCAEAAVYTVTVVSSNPAAGTATGGGQVHEGDSLTVNAQAAENYVFAGWYDGDTLMSTSAAYTFVPEKTMTLTAKFTAVQFAITYDLAGGELPQGKSNPAGYNVDTPSFKLEEPEKTGYTFAGWTGTGLTEATKDVTIASGSTGSRSYTATWTKDSYTITYDLAGGNLPEGKSNPAGYSVDSEAITLVNPEKTGYTFAGWTGTGLTEATKDVTIASGSTGSRSYTATWTREAYTITYDLAGGELPQGKSNPAGYNVDTPSFKLEEPEKTGYTFAGWTGTGLTEATKDVTIASGSTGNRSYTATWTVNQYTISFDTDGGNAIEPIVADYGAAVAKPADPQKSGWTFAGWNMTIPATMPAENLTIKATWTKDSYTITYDLAGGNLPEGKSNPVGYSVDSEAITLVNPEKTGYTFAGWTGTGLTEATKDVTIASGSTGNRSYTATWTVNQYTISFDTDGGNAIEPIVADYGTAVTKPADPQKSGWTFAGWDMTIPATMPAENLTIKATWTKDSYTITYDLAGGNLPEGKSNPAGYSVDTPSFKLEEPEKTGYTFAGWTGSNGDTPQKDIGVATGSMGNLNFTANYAPEVYSITIDLNGGAMREGETNPTTYTIETESFTLKNPEMDGHAFVGWTGSNGEEAQQSITIAKGSTGDLSYTANYSLNHYQVSVSCDPAMGTVTGGGEYGHGTQATLSAEPNAGYVFMRWVNDQGETVSEEAVYSFTVYGPCSLTAVFEAQAVDLPKTGDDSNLALWCSLMMMCSACALMLARKRRA